MRLTEQVLTAEQDEVGASATVQEHGGAFRALRIRSFRWWFIAQIVSGSGGMMLIVAQAWLVLHVLHGGGLALGALASAQFLPVMLGSAWAGTLLDHSDVRRVLIGTQVAGASVAALLGVLITTGAVRLWMVFVLAIANGCVFALDQPARQVYVVRLIGAERVASAIGLYEVILNASRVLGPASGGVILALVGTAACFYVNALSFIPVLVVLLVFRPAEEVVSRGPRTRAREALRDGIRYVKRTPAIAACLLMAAAAGMLFNLGNALPVLATRTLHLDRADLGLFIACFGLGAIPGGFAAAYTRNDGMGRKVRVLCLLTGLAVLFLAGAHGRLLAFLLLGAVGFLSIWMIALANTVVQLRTTPGLRGRVMGLWTMVLPGLSPVTSLAVGALTQWVGPRAGYGFAGVALICAAIVGWRPLGE